MTLNPLKNDLHLDVWSWRELIQVFSPTDVTTKQICNSFQVVWTDRHTHTHTRGTGRPLVWKTWKCQGICSCQGNVGDFTKSQGNVVEKILSGKRWLEPFIVSCIFVPIQVFSSSTGMIWVTHLTSRGEVPRTVREMSGEFHIVWTPESGHAGGRLSWLLVSFSLHVKYTLSYRIVSSWW